MNIKDNFPDPWDKHKNPWDKHKPNPYDPWDKQDKWHPPTPPKPATIADLFPRLDRLSIGWSPILDQLKEITQTKPSYPPYDIVSLQDGKYDVNLLNIAVAGFTKDELTVTIQDSVLTIEGRQNDKQRGEVLYQGIATRDFKLKLAVAEFWEVANARLENGMLTIQFNRELPEEKKPKVIDINEV